MIRKRLAIIVISVFILFAFTDATTQAQEPTTEALPLDVILLIDSSPSMEKTDPDNLRISAARFLLDYLEATSEVLGLDYFAGLVNFGGQVSETPIRLQSVGSLDRELVIAEEIRYTDFRPALDKAFKYLKPQGPASTKAVILFTDGHPQLTDNELSDKQKENYFLGTRIANDKKSPEQMKELVEKLREEEIQLFVVAVGDADEDADLWQALLSSKDHYRKIDNTTNLAAIYREFVADLTGLAVSSSELLTDGEPPFEIPLQPYLENAIFSFVKDEPDVKISITSPNGNPPRLLGGGKDELYEIYRVSNPEGQNNRSWQVEVEEGHAQMWVDQQLPTLVIDAPEGALPKGKDITVRGWLEQRKKRVEDENLTLMAKIRHQGRTESIPMTSIGDGMYKLDLKDFDTLGSYSVKLTTPQDDKSAAIQSESATFEIHPVPEIESVEIGGEWGEDNLVTLVAEINHADRLPVNTAIEAHIEDDTGNPIATIQLYDRGQGSDEEPNDGQFAADMIWEAQNEPTGCVITIAGTSKDGVPFASSYEYQERSSPPIIDLIPILTKVIDLIFQNPQAGGPGWLPSRDHMPRWHYILIFMFFACVITMESMLRQKYNTSLIPKRFRRTLLPKDEIIVSNVLRNERRYRHKKSFLEFIQRLPAPKLVDTIVNAGIEKYNGDINDNFSRAICDSGLSIQDYAILYKSLKRWLEESRPNQKIWIERQILIMENLRGLEYLLVCEFDEYMISPHCVSPHDLFAEATENGLLLCYLKHKKREIKNKQYTIGE